MDQPGQDAPLVEEAPDDAVGVHPALDQLDGDLLLEPRLVPPDGQIDGAHAPPAELGHDPVRADQAPGHRRLQILPDAGGHRRRALLEAVVRPLVGGEQSADLGDQRGVAGRRRIQPGAAGGEGLVERVAEELLDPLPALSLHRPGRSAPHLDRQPGLGDRPVPLHRRLRNPQGSRGLLHRQPGEEAQLDDAGLLRVVVLKIV